MSSCLLTNQPNTRNMDVQYSSNAEFDSSNLQASSTPTKRVFLRSTHERIYGAFTGHFGALFPVDSLSTRKRLTNSFDREWLGLNIQDKTMQALFASRGGARKNALEINFAQFKKLNIVAARSRLRDAVSKAYYALGHNHGELERLLLHKLTTDANLQQAANRVLIGIVLQDSDLAPQTRLETIQGLFDTAHNIHNELFKYIKLHNTPYDDQLAVVHKEISNLKDFAKEARKAVA